MDMGEFPPAENDVWPRQWQIIKQPKPLRAGQGHDCWSYLNIRQRSDAVKKCGVNLWRGLDAQLDMRDAGCRFDRKPRYKQSGR